MSKVHYENVEQYKGYDYTMTRSAGREYATVWVVFKKDTPGEIYRHGYTNNPSFSKADALDAAARYFKPAMDTSLLDGFVAKTNEVAKKSKLEKGVSKGFKKTTFKTGDATDPVKAKSDKAIEALYGPVAKLPEIKGESKRGVGAPKGNAFAKKAAKEVKVGGPRVKAGDLESLRAIADKRGVKLGFVIDEMISAYIEGNV